MRGLRLLLALFVVGCAQQSSTAVDEEGWLRTWCSRWNPSMQKAALAAIVYGGGPAVVEVDGWMCGPSRRGSFTRIVMLRYTDPEVGYIEPVVPVVFEDGRMIAFGWSLLRTEPDRYGIDVPSDPARWRPPKGWVDVR